jgi:hypothetical protein
MAKRKTKIIQLDNGREADAVEELWDALRGAPIFVSGKNKLAWRFADNAALPLNISRLRAELPRYVTFTRKGKTIDAPGDLLEMFLQVAFDYHWFPNLPEDE